MKYCQELDCVWRDSCDMFRTYSNQLSRIADEEWMFQVESFLGHMIEHFKEDVLEEILEQDYGLVIYPTEGLTDSEKDNIVNTWFDAMNYLASSCQLSTFYDVCCEMNYWPSDVSEIEQEAVEDSSEANDVKIREQMLRWATERSIQ